MKNFSLSLKKKKNQDPNEGMKIENMGETFQN